MSSETKSADDDIISHCQKTMAYFYGGDYMKH